MHPPQRKAKLYETIERFRVYCDARRDIEAFGYGKTPPPAKKVTVQPVIEDTQPEKTTNEELTHEDLLELMTG
jgi:hypothetical protein